MKIRSEFLLLILTSTLTLSLFANGGEQETKPVTCAGRCAFYLFPKGWSPMQVYEQNFSDTGSTAHEAMLKMNRTCEDWAHRTKSWYISETGTYADVKYIKLTSSKKQAVGKFTEYQGFSLDDCDSKSTSISINNTNIIE